MLLVQGQAHYVNGTLYFCHTSCDLLNAGTVQAYLEEVAAWVRDNPYDVVTILIGNADYAMTNSEGVKNITAETYVEPIQNSGLAPYLYYPPKIPMGNDCHTEASCYLHGLQCQPNRCAVYPGRVYSDVGDAILTDKHQLSVRCTTSAELEQKFESRLVVYCKP
jgi:hypothetical protein